MTHTTENSKEFKGIIKNLDKGTYLYKENGDKIRHTKSEDKALIFYEEWDAEATLLRLNDELPDCYQLITF